MQPDEPAQSLVVLEHPVMGRAGRGDIERHQQPIGEDGHHRHRQHRRQRQHQCRHGPECLSGLDQDAASREKSREKPTPEHDDDPDGEDRGGQRQADRHVRVGRYLQRALQHRVRLGHGGRGVGLEPERSRQQQQRHNRQADGGGGQVAWRGKRAGGGDPKQGQHSRAAAARRHQPVRLAHALDDGGEGRLVYFCRHQCVQRRGRRDTVALQVGGRVGGGRDGAAVELARDQAAVVPPHVLPGHVRTFCRADGRVAQPVRQAREIHVPAGPDFLGVVRPVDTAQVIIGVHPRL
mmetsp:Transcript_22210/g.71757  ORF Transcript_22210/g.71757 Transcript_22210/m.71757 type:complete len:293 (-) Transcript_22210:13-891(-)